MAGVSLSPLDFNRDHNPIKWQGDIPGLTPNWPDPRELEVVNPTERSVYFATTGKLTKKGNHTLKEIIRNTLLRLDRASYNILDVVFDINKLPEEYQEGTIKLLDAIDLVGEFYWLLRYLNYHEMKAEISSSGSLERIKHFEVGGPKCLTIKHDLCTTHPNTDLDELYAVTSGVPELVKQMEEKNPDHPISSPYTAIVPADENEAGAVEHKGKWYKAVPYNEHPDLKPVMQKISTRFQEAAILFETVGPLLAEQCRTLSEAYSRWELPLPLEKSFLAWKETVASDSPIQLIHSVEWAYAGRGKALPSADLLVLSSDGVDKVETLKDNFAVLAEYAKELFPKKLRKLIPDRLKGPHTQQGEIVYGAGGSLAPEYLAGGSIIPNDGSLAKTGSTVLTYYQNIFRARQSFEANIIAELTISPILVTMTADLSDAVFAMAHETSHNSLCDGETEINGVKLGKKLGQIHHSFEEAKADLLGLYYIYRLKKMGLYSEKLYKQSVASMVKNLARNLYRGHLEREKDPVNWDAHYSAAYIVFDALTKRGILYFSEDEKIVINYDKLNEFIDNVIVDTVSPYIEGDREKCESILNNAVSRLPEHMKEKFGRIESQRLPSKNRIRFHVIGRGP